MGSECLFIKYTKRQIDENYEAPHISYGTLLKKCTCKNCMKEKEINKRTSLNRWGFIIRWKDVVYDE